MDNKQAKILIQKTFNDSFDRSRFIKFVKELLNEIDESKHGRWSGQVIKRGFDEAVKYYERIGTYTAPEGEKIDILIVYLEKYFTLERARTLQRNFVAYHLKKRAEKEAGLVAFVSPNGEDWRFSLVKMEYHLEQTQEGKVKVEEDLTPAKRFSFIVGKNENSHTAQKQLLPILEDDKNNPTLKEIEKAFSIEAVTKEFFNKYKDLFLNFKEEFDKILEKDKKITADFSDKGINTADFAKKLLGQIVFLYFLQRKGWLGVDKNSNWGSGPKNFLRALFERKYCNYENFFNDVLEPLFYRALATDRGEQAYDDRFDCRIPFLNGGLFEPIQDYDWVNTDIIIPNDLFSNDYKTKEGDIGSGILDFFDRYNFTIKEDEPLEKEVAIDPEMLGKVFENLLEIKDRKSKGAYYTPREIVHYMCQESLINYLATESDNKLPREDIETFIHLGDFAVEHDMAKTQGIIKDDGKYKLPQGIHENAELIDRKLAEITVCDPAIGSGAFPVGMMNEIVRARGALNATKTFKDTKCKRTPYSFKRHAIQNSLYGVDIDPGAVEIAKLRLWLSLVVDEEEMTEIKPLPNLDYKIMQGNSLLEEYEGIKLFDESLILDTVVEKKKRQEEIGKRKSALQQEYFKLHSEGKLNGIRKSEIEKEMKALQKEESALTKVETGGNSSLFDQESIAKKKAEELNRLHKEFFDMALKSNKAEIKKQIDELEWELIEETLKEHGKEKELPKLQTLRRSNNKPFFLWKLHFAEVFQKKGGFDVVIANPPYGASLSKKELRHFMDTFSTASYKIDTYGLFIEKAFQLAKIGSAICFICPYTWTKINQFKNLRSFMLQKNIKFIIDLPTKIFQNADLDTLVFLACNEAPEREIRIGKYEKGEIILNSKLNTSVCKGDINYIININLSEEDIILNKKIKDNSIRLGEKFEVCQGLIPYDKYRGHTNEQIKNRVWHADKSIDKSYKKELLGKNIERYYLDPKIERYIQYGPQLAAPREEKFFTHPRILIREITRGKKYKISATYTDQEYYNTPVIINIIHPKDNIKYLKALLGLINSRLVTYFHIKNNPKATAETSIPKILVEDVRRLPIPKLFFEEVDEIIHLVDQILEIKNRTRNVETIDALEEKIDNIIYKIYGLTPEEIQIVEKSLS